MASASPINMPSIQPLHGIRAVDLMQKEFPEPKWAIPGILPEGLSILGAKPKKGKSILALNIGLAIAGGGLALGKIQVEQGTVMYLALEDTERRLQDRMQVMLQGKTPPNKLYLYTESLRMGARGDILLQEEMLKHSDLRLVVIDTWARFSPVSSGSSGTSYHEDYKQVSLIKKVADTSGIPILLIHHLRKMEAEDVWDTFSGSLGLTGAADSLLVLATEPMGQGPSYAVLHVTGRDVEADAYPLNFDNNTLSWTLAGEIREMKLTNKQRMIVDACKAITGTLSPTQIAEASGLTLQYVKNTLPKLVERGNLKRQTGVNINLIYKKYEYYHYHCYHEYHEYYRYRVRVVIRAGG